MWWLMQARWIEPGWAKKRFSILLLELSLTLQAQLDSLRMHIRASIGVLPTKSSSHISWSAWVTVLFVSNISLSDVQSWSKICAGFNFALESLQHQQRNNTAPYTQKIAELTELLENYFKED